MPDSQNQRNGPLALRIFLLALSLRVILDLLFFLRSGWFSSHLIEVWFYYGVARGVFTLALFDPTFLLLRLPGLLLPGGVLYPAVVFEAALISALTAVLIFYWLNHRYGRSTGFWGGLLFALLPAPLTLSLVNFSHDLVQAPLVVLFFWATTAALRGGEKRGKAFAASIVCLLFGLMVGPLMAAALIIVLIAALCSFLDGITGKKSALWISGLYLLGLVLINYGLYLIMKPHLLEWFAPLAMKFRGIDLLAQIRIRVGDLQPLPPDAFWNRYTLCIFFLPWGLWLACRKRHFFLLTLFLFSLALSLVVNRGARLLDLAVVAVTASGLAEWGKNALRVTIIAVITIILLDLLGGTALMGSLSFTLPKMLEGIYIGIPFGLKQLWRSLAGWLSGRPVNLLELYCALIFTGLLVVSIIGAFLLKGGKKWPVRVLLPVIVLLQGSWVFVAAQTSSEEMEYVAYRWLNEHSRPKEKIFAAWNQGYFIGAVTHLEPVTTPERIDLSLTRLYWEDEVSAARALHDRGVEYVHVSSRYFGITGVNRENDSFTMRGNTIIGPQPTHIRRFSAMRRTLLFRLLYEPNKLEYFTPIYEKIDQRQQVMVRIFRVK